MNVKALKTALYFYMSVVGSFTMIAVMVSSIAAM